MPVYNSLVCSIFPGAILDYKHACGTAETHLSLLADYIKVGTVIYSPGDFFLVASWRLSYVAGLFLTVSFAEYVYKKIVRVKV